MTVRFRPMLAADAMLLELQASQHYELGLHEPAFTRERGEDLAENGLAWTAQAGDGRILAVAGFRELYQGHAVAWAAFAGALGRAGVAVTRFARRQLAAVPYHRVEAIVEADNDRAIAWALAIGLEASPHPLLKYGPEARTHILFERIQ